MTNPAVVPVIGAASISLVECDGQGSLSLVGATPPNQVVLVPVGEQGPPGAGVPVGGAAGQILTKTSAADFDTSWQDAPAGVTDHGALTGLGDDDHPQYAFRKISLTAATTFFVRPDGNDANNGSTNDAAGAFATPQGALNYLYANVDLNRFTATIQLAAGTYPGFGIPTSAQNLYPLDGRVVITGVSGNPSAVVIGAHPTVTGANVVLIGAFNFFTVQNLSIDLTGRTLAIRAWIGAFATFSNLRFIGTPGTGSNVSPFDIRYNTMAELAGTFTFELSAANITRFLSSAFGSSINFSGSLTAINPVNWSSEFAEGGPLGRIRLFFNTITGTFTGRKFLSRDGGIINVSAAEEAKSFGSTDGVHGFLSAGPPVRGSDAATKAYVDEMQLRSFTVATLPSATPAGRQIYVSDESGGPVPAFADGTNWRRVTDRAIVS